MVSGRLWGGWFRAHIWGQIDGAKIFKIVPPQLFLQDLLNKEKITCTPKKNQNQPEQKEQKKNHRTSPWPILTWWGLFFAASWGSAAPGLGEGVV